MLCPPPPAPRPPPPARAQIAIEPKSKGDAEKMTTGLIKLAQEDPSFHFSRDEETNQTVGGRGRGREGPLWGRPLLHFTREQGLGQQHGGTGLPARDYPQRWAACTVAQQAGRPAWRISPSCAPPS